MAPSRPSVVDQPRGTSRRSRRCRRRGSPRILAICAASEPVAPAAAERRPSRPPWPRRCRGCPKYAVSPVAPRRSSSGSGSAPSAERRGRAPVVAARRRTPASPGGRTTRSPTANRSLRDATHPADAAAAHDLADLDRRAGSPRRRLSQVRTVASMPSHSTCDQDLAVGRARDRRGRPARRRRLATGPRDVGADAIEGWCGR